MSKESAPGLPATVSIPLPGYIDPKALEIGRTVIAHGDTNNTRLVVIRIEPALVVAAPDGETHIVLAQDVEVVES